jgi:hypothetical protein
MRVMDWTYPGLILLLIAAPLTLWRELREASADARTKMKNRPWVPFLVVALTMVPTSLMGRLKVGGFDNSYHFLIYLDVAALLALSLKEWGHEGGSFRPWIATLAVSACLLGIFVPVLPGPNEMDPLSPGFGRDELLYDSPYDEADRLRREHRGEVHFLYNPLTPLYRDGRLTHFEYGLYDRMIAGFLPSDEHLRRHLPPKISLLVTSIILVEDLSRYRRLAPAGTKFRESQSGKWHYYAYEP